MDERPWKVGYQQANGYESTAYIYPKLDTDGNVLLNEPFDGTNKHTDEPLKVMWTGEDWVEVPL
jgi:hypothetical protein